MRIDVRAVEDLNHVERAGMQSLFHAVYSSDFIATWPGRWIEWSPRPWSLLVWNGDQLVGHVGMLVRSGRCNLESVRIGGVGGVRTHPDFRGQGRASAAMKRSIEFFRERGDVDFALLGCEPALIPFYQRLGWQVFPGSLFITQRGRRQEFTAHVTMTQAISRECPGSGTIDLVGPPW